jgi:hypothetical protein
MIHVDLNENAETRLRATAEAEGIPAEVYAKELLEIALDAPEQSGTAQSAREALGDYIGAIDTSTIKAILDTAAPSETSPMRSTRNRASRFRNGNANRPACRAR